MSFVWLDDKESAKVEDYFVERFGMDREKFADFAMFQKGDYINILALDAREAAQELDPSDAGLPLAKLTHSKTLKPVTRGVQVFCNEATSNVVEIEPADLKGLIEGRSVESGDLKGFVILKMGGCAVGVGLAREGRLLSQFPKAMTHHLDLRNGGEIL